MPLKGDLDDEDEFQDDYPRHFDDLTPAEKQILGNLTPATLRSCEVLRDWMDDHQVCVLVNVNGIEFGAWWCGWETAGAFLYADSPKAKETICQYLKDNIADSINSDLEDEADEQRELEAQDSVVDDDEITPEDLPHA